MKQQATVVEAEGKLMAEIIRPEACAQCRACRYGQQARMLLPLEGEGFRPGDRVELELSEESFSKASLLAYAFPLALFLGGLFLSSRLTENEVLMAAAGLAALGVGLLTMRLLEPKLKKSGLFAPKVSRCAAARIEPDKGGEE